MSSMLSSQGVVLATAMAAVSGTIILLAFRLQKPLSSTTHFSSVNAISSDDQPLPRSCISSDEKKEDKKKKKKKKRVHFAEDVVDPIGNSEEYRKLRGKRRSFSDEEDDSDDDSDFCNNGRRMPANRAALYNGILRDRVLHRVAYSC